MPHVKVIKLPERFRDSSREKDIGGPLRRLPVWVLFDQNPENNPLSVLLVALYRSARVT